MGFDEVIQVIAPVAEWAVLVGFDVFAQFLVYKNFDIFYPLSLIASYGFCVTVLQPWVSNMIGSWKHQEWGYHLWDNAVPLPTGFFRACLLKLYGSHTFFKDMFIGGSAAYAAYSTREFVNYTYSVESSKIKIKSDGEIVHDR